MPKLKGGLAAQRGGGAEVSEICGGDTELIPEVRWSVTCEAHCVCLAHDHSM
jgi:hypothetical protein